MDVYKFLVVGIALFVIVILGFGTMVPDTDIPIPTNNTTTEYQQYEMVRETSNILYNSWFYLGVGCLVLAIILAILAYKKVLR
jgi:hypothetical protein